VVCQALKPKSIFPKYRYEKGKTLYNSEILRYMY
jgi:hypothetical protein